MNSFASRHCLRAIAAFVLVLLLSACGEEGPWLGGPYNPSVPVEVNISGGMKGRTQVIWINDEPTRALLEPILVELTDTPLKTGSNTIRIVDVSGGLKPEDPVHCAMAIRGKPTAVPLKLDDQKSLSGAFEVPGGLLTPRVEPGTMDDESAAKVEAWLLSVLTAVRDKDAVPFLNKVEGFRDAACVGMAPLMEEGFQLRSVLHDKADVQLHRGRGILLVTANPDPSTGLSRELMDGKLGDVRWIVTSLEVMKAKDGKFYLGTHQGWKQILDLKP